MLIVIEVPIWCIEKNTLLGEMNELYTAKDDWKENWSERKSLTTFVNN